MQDEEKRRFVENIKEEVNESQTKTADIFAYFVVGLFCAVLVLIIVVYGLERSKNNAIAALDESIKIEVTDPLSAMAKERKQNDDVIRQLATLTTALSGRVKYSQLMTDMSSGLYKKSMWTTFSLQDNVITISGVADSFDDAAKTVAAYRKLKTVKEIDLKSVNLNSEIGKVDFSYTITFDNKNYTYINPSQAQATQTPTAVESMVQ